MVECNVEILRMELFASLLNRLFLDGAHPFDLKLRAEGGGDVLEHHSQRIVKSCRGEEEAQEKQEIQIPCDPSGRSLRER